MRGAGVIVVAVVGLGVAMQAQVGRPEPQTVRPGAEPGRPDGLRAPGQLPPTTAPPARPAAAASTLDALVEAERLFARDTARLGIRAGFLAWFAREAIGFRPALGNARQQIEARPVPANPTATRLEWEPRVGDVAGDAALGWLTGPSVLIAADGSRRYGNYLSIWKKTADGWRVQIDVGADAPSPVPFEPGFTRMPARHGRYTAPARPTAHGVTRSLTALHDADADANRPLGFVAALADEARLHRPGHLPLVGRTAIATGTTGTERAGRWTSLATHQATSLDLGYSYGRHDPASGPAPDQGGYYVRVWRRNAKGAWQIVAQVDQPDGR